MIDPNGFNGIEYNINSFKGYSFLENVEKESNAIYYDISLTEAMLDARDPEARCGDYGKDYFFLTYHECIEKRAKESLAIFGCNLPWFTDDEGEICRNNTPNINKVFKHNYEIYEGTIRSFIFDSYFQPWPYSL